MTELFLSLSIWKIEVFGFIYSPSCSLDPNSELFIAALDFLFLLCCPFLVSFPIKYCYLPHSSCNLLTSNPDQPVSPSGLLASVTSFTPPACTWGPRGGCLLSLKFYPPSERSPYAFFWGGVKHPIFRASWSLTSLGFSFSLRTLTSLSCLMGICGHGQTQRSRTRTGLSVLLVLSSAVNILGIQMFRNWKPWNWKPFNWKHKHINGKLCLIFPLLLLPRLSQKRTFFPAASPTPPNLAPTPNVLSWKMIFLSDSDKDV